MIVRNIHHLQKQLAEVDAFGFAVANVIGTQVTITGFQHLTAFGPVHRKIALIFGHQATAVASRDSSSARPDMCDGPVL